MKALYSKMRPSKWVWQRMLMAGVVAGVAALAFCWGRHGALSSATAQGPGRAAGEPLPALAPVTNSDYARRVVAFIHGTIPITREDLGEYLIARFGAERVEFLVNRRIIEYACQAARITVTDEEVEKQINDDLKSFGPMITRNDFVNNILKRYHKTLYEWKEDVIRPKLALMKFCKDKVVVTEQDLQEAFEAQYGDKVECRMIVMPKEMPGDQRTALWTKVSKSDQDFDVEAKKQFIPQLASQGGKVPAIHKHFGDDTVEKAAFALHNPGDVTSLLELQDKTWIILKMVQRIPANTVVKFNDERAALHRAVYEVKLSQEIPKVFATLRAQARPNILLRHELTRQEQANQVQEQIKGVPGASRPQGN